MCQRRSAWHLRACCAGFHSGQTLGSDQICGACAAALPRPPLSSSSPGCSCLHPGNRLTQPAQMRKLSARWHSQVLPCGHQGQDPPSPHLCIYFARKSGINVRPSWVARDHTWDAAESERTSREDGFAKDRCCCCGYLAAAAAATARA